MEFEDPRWWEHLPSLKGIGLAAMMVEKVRQADVIKTSVSKAKEPSPKILTTVTFTPRSLWVR